MKCDLCGHETYSYTGILNLWYECLECGALYCDTCSRGAKPRGPGYAAPEDLYRISKMRRCVMCGGPLYNKRPG